MQHREQPGTRNHGLYVRILKNHTCWHHRIYTERPLQGKAAWNGAEQAYGLAARYMPEDAQLFMFLGDAQYHLGKMDEAKRSFEQALSLASGDRGALAPLIQERLNALP